MRTASIKELKQELKHRSQGDLLDLCLRLSRFKKENKELLSYLLFEASNELAYIQGIRDEMDKEFEEINTDSVYYIKKSVRKILRHTKTYIRYSKKKETEVELLLYFCMKLKGFNPVLNGNISMQNLFDRQIALIKKAMSGLHEDLQYDYRLELQQLLGNES